MRAGMATATGLQIGGGRAGIVPPDGHLIKKNSVLASMKLQYLLAVRSKTVQKLSFPKNLASSRLIN